MRSSKRLKLFPSRVLCLLFCKFDGLVEDLINIILNFGLKVWPNEDVLFQLDCDVEMKLKTFQENYEKSIDSKIVESKLVIAIITNEFLKSEKCKALIDLAKQSKKIILALVVENVENFASLNGVDFFYEVYKDRVYETGYDDYMWTGECFDQFLVNIETHLQEKFVSEPTFKLIL